MDIISNQKKARKIVSLLKKHYGENPLCHLNAKKDYEFLFAVCLSAQTTDRAVNKVTPILYARYKTLKDFATANAEDIEEIIHSIGFYHNKARNLIVCARQLLETYGGKVPSTMDELLTLKGVGRKTANVYIGCFLGKPAMAVDTHVGRISNRLFCISEKTPDKIEEKLRQIIAPKDYVLWNTHIISFGREICTAQKPKCMACFLSKYCEWHKI